MATMQELREKIEANIKARQALISELNGLFDCGRMIPYEVFAEMPYFTRITILPELIWTERRKNRGTDLVYRSVFLEGAELGRHLHDCPEIIIVLTGHVMDLTSGKGYLAGEEIDIDPHTVHNIFATRDSELEIIFKKP